jgi:exonuclease III
MKKFKMIVLSYNIKGLRSTHKRNSVKRLVLANNPKVMLIQESILEASKVKDLLLVVSLGWSFEAIGFEG